MMDWPNEKLIQIKAYIVVHPFHILQPQNGQVEQEKMKAKTEIMKR